MNYLIWNAEGKIFFENIPEPASNQNNIIEFTDAANDWLNAKILLKKM